MRAVIQRVTRARVIVEGSVTGEIEAGLAVLVAAGRDDTAATAVSMAEKIVNLRIFNPTIKGQNKSFAARYRRSDSRGSAIHALR